MKILIAEDDTTSRLVLGATLKKLGHDVTATADGQQAWDALGKEHFSLLISDWMMPDMDGLELCRRIRAGNQAQYTYIILLTALSGKTSYLDEMDAGADDFITKPFDADQLAARLRVADRILALHETLRTQAMFDGLTGLLNRTAIVACLSGEMERAARGDQPLSVVILDLDHFKQVNGCKEAPTGLSDNVQNCVGALQCVPQVLAVVPGQSPREHCSSNNCSPCENAESVERHRVPASPKSGPDG